MGKTFSMVIPAYNEEDAIEDILKKCLAAREPIRRETGLSQVEVIAVDDGSRDKTQELARAFPEVKLVVHPVNRGYGAALVTGFEAAGGDYLGFLDADGTCDPLSFISLYRALSEKKADMAVGNRLHDASQMPKVRELGNRFYAQVVSRLTGVKVNDTASGMRLFSREMLFKLYPLPTGLHFTPAMTARAACMGAKIVETPIPYSERQGESKLNVVADGIRFLRVILGIIFAYYPLRIFGPAGLFFAAVAAAYGFPLVVHYLQAREVQVDAMVYRLLTVTTLSVCSLVCLTFGGIAQRVSDIATRRRSGWLEKRGTREAAVILGAALILGGVLLNSKTIAQYVTSGRIGVPWIYVLTGGLAVISGTVLASFGITLGLVGHLPYALDGAKK